MDKDSQHMLDAYIHDYLVKKKYINTSETFLSEAEVPTGLNVIDAPGGFLYEWWAVFWDMFIARYMVQVPHSVASSNETQQCHQNFQQQKQHNMHIHEYLLHQKMKQRKQLLKRLQLEQQQNEETRQQLQIRQQLILNASAAKMYQESLKAGNRDIVGSSLDPNLATTMKSLSGKSGHTPHAPSGGISNYILPTKSQETLPLNGWPVKGLHNLQRRSLQEQNSMMQSPQSPDQLLLQRQLMLQAQKSLPLSFANDLERRKLWMLFNERNMSSDGLGLQVWHPGVSQGNVDVQIKASGIQTGQKRKRLMSSSIPPDTSTSSSTGPSPSSASLTPSSHTKDGMFSAPTLLHNEDFSPRACLAGDNYEGSFVSATNHLGPTDFFVGDESLIETADSFLSLDNEGGMDTCEGSSFSEVGSIHANQVDHCHLSSDGKLLVTSGNDEKARLWCTDLLEQKCTLQEHSCAITDTRFSPITSWLATSSLDKTVRVWDAENVSKQPGHSLRTFVGHSAPVTSLDFHPNKGDLICSSDDINEIRYWSIKNDGCARVLKGGSAKVRFQPVLGKYLAAAVGIGTSIIDVETAETSRNPLQGHSLNVQSLCWDFSGELLASVSEDRVRVWKIGSGAQHNCIHELSLSTKKFRCCVFHPLYPSLLIIGCSQSLELWNMAENKLMTSLGDPISAVAVSEITGVVASASQDNNYVKMWKWI